MVTSSIIVWALTGLRSLGLLVPAISCSVVWVTAPADDWEVWSAGAVAAFCALVAVSAALSASCDLQAASGSRETRSNAASWVDFMVVLLRALRLGSGPKWTVETAPTPLSKGRARFGAQPSIAACV